MKKKTKGPAEESRQSKGRQGPHRYPKKTLMDARTIIDAIKEHSGDTKISRIDLATKMGYSPGGSHFRMLVSAANRFGLIDGNYTSPTLKMTELGESIAFKESDEEEVQALRQGFLKVAVFSNILGDYNGKKLPRDEVLHNVLKKKYGIELADAKEFEKILCDTSKYIGIAKEHKGELWIELGAEVKPLKEVKDDESEQTKTADDSAPGSEDKPSTPTQRPDKSLKEEAPSKNAFFIGHGKNKKPLKQLKEFLTKYRIPFKVDEDEPYKGRPISKKVKDMFSECGAAILIFTADEEFQDKQGEKIWRPSQNVIHELAVASYLYENKIIILKEDKIELPSNVSDLGYIEFSEGDIESKIGGLLQELIGMGIVTLCVAS